MLDASGRIPKAITQGNRLDEGTFDLCVNINEKLDVIGQVSGKYCYGGLTLPINISTVDAQQLANTDALALSICIPNACAPSDLFDTLGVDGVCQTKNQNKFLDAGDIVCL